ncbi:MAG: DUF6076 domain-containing protein [Oscillospiraceae bacterium]|nr:DUF6076 domain-containing protein [Oscillospiraceae bacterium]
MRDELALGLFNPRHAEKLYDEILYKINAISRAKPFCYLDLDGESERCKQLFSDETANKISEYLRKRALFYNEDQTGWANHPLPRQSDISEFREGEALLQDYIKMIAFYEELGCGIDSAHQIGKAFVAALEAPVKRSEGNLMAMALQCIAEYRPHGFTVFDRDMRVNMEYVSVQKNKSASVISRRMTFERFGDFLLADFFEGLHVGHYPLLCGVCKRYFLQMTARHRKYCDGYAPDDTKGRSCVAFAARSKRLLAKELSADRPLNEIYNTRRGTIDKHVQRGKITLEQAAAAKRYIEKLHDKAEFDNDYFNNEYKEDMEQEAVYAAVGIKL